MTHRFDDFEFFRLVSAPRPPDQAKGPDPTPSQLFAALTAAHASLLVDAEHSDNAALMVAWIRPPGTCQIRFLVGGRPYFPLAGRNGSGDGANRPILYPPGATGTPLTPGDATALLDSLSCWVSCAGRADALWLPDGDQSADPLRGSFDDYVAHIQSPFAWVIEAQPQPSQAVDDELDRLSVRLPLMRKRENSERDRLDLLRAEGRYRELTRARVTGLWRVWVLVGGPTPTDARVAAALLCSASELENVPYVLVPEPTSGTLAQAAAATHELKDGASVPFTAPSELLLALARPPSRELPGIRLTTQHRFDVTAETSDTDGFPIGEILDEAYRSAGTFRIPRATLNRHAFICGATGSGKSQTMRGLLEQLSRDVEPVPWLVIEPAKAEYAGMAGRLTGISDVIVIRPGDPDVAPASINPLEPEPGFPLQSHADLVRALFLAAFEANEPFPQVLSRALTQVYTDAGWDLVTGLPRPAIKPKLYSDEPSEPITSRYPTLGELQRTAQHIVEQVGYGPEITADVRGFVDVRIGSLREGTPGRFFEGGHPLDIAGLLKQNTVLELENITNDQDKAFLIGAVLIRIVEHLRVRHSRQQRVAILLHVTVVEEAHRLLKNVQDGPAAAAVELFASLLAEIRAYGEGVVVVEQIPSKILSDVIKNSALKIMHRLPAADDREAVGATINLKPDQSELVVSLPPGIAAAAIDGMDRPVLLSMPTREDAEDDASASKEPPLAGSRSTLCSTPCGSQPCQLRLINDARHTAHHPEVIVWVEAVVMSFIIGRQPPTPTQRTMARLHDIPAREVDCALVHAVETAIAARRPWLTPWVDLDDFAQHINSVLRDQLASREVNEDNWERWTAGMFRWQEIRIALQQAVDRGDAGNGLHPSSSGWKRLGMQLEGPTIADQMEALLAHPVYADGKEQVTTGDFESSQLAWAVLQITGALTRSCLQAALITSCSGQTIQVIVGQVAHILCHDENSPTTGV
ncbi:MAG: helicase HerA domain-containing protein [Labedaea sp.]